MAQFKFADKVVEVHRFDPSDPERKPLDIPWDHQHIYDQLDDSRVFSDDELNEIADMDGTMFRAHLHEAST